MRLLSKRAFWIGIAIVLTACGGGSSDDDDGTPGGSVEPPPDATVDPNVDAFEKTLHPVLVSSCGGCHGDSGNSSQFAVTDSKAAYDRVLLRGLANLNDPSSSTLVSYMDSGHNCGANCDAIGDSFAGAITQWNSLISGNPTPEPSPIASPVVSPPPSSPPSDDPVFGVFEDTLHPLLLASCGGCHGDSGSNSQFAVANSEAAYSRIEARGLVDLDDPSESTFVAYMLSGHNCSDCNTLANDMVIDIIAMANARPSDPTPVVTPTPTPTPVIVPTPTPSPTPQIVLNDQQKVFSETLYPILRSSCIGCHAEIVNSSNTGIDLPKFAHNNIVIAHSVVTNRSLVSLQDPGSSRFVTRLRDDEHACWTNCDQDANTVIDAINAWAGVDPGPGTPVEPPDNPPVEPPSAPNKQASIDAFGNSVWLVTRQNCATCHSGNLPGAPAFAHVDTETAHDVVIERSLANVDEPASSVLVEYLRDRLHNCWPSTDDCESNASVMEAAIALWQQILLDDDGSANSQPVAVDDRFETLEGTSVTTGIVTLNDADADEDDTLSIQDAETLSAEGGVVVNNGNGTFTYTPPFGFSGEDSFQYTIVDTAGASDSATVYIDVLESSGITAVEDQINANQNATQFITNLLDNDIVAPGRTLTIVTVDNDSAAGGIVTRGNGSLVTYTPPTGFSGNDSFAYSITDGINFANGLVNINVNAQPIAVSDAAYTYTGLDVVISNVLDNDIDTNEGDTLTITSVDTTNTIGDVTLNPDGTFTYDPEDGVGQDSFDYIVSDGRGGASSATVFINVVDPIFGDDDRFLQFLNQSSPSREESEQTARAYYATIDPAGRRTTLEDFRELNGFDIGADANTIYINANDLGFTRRMFVREDPITGTVASYVENYPNIESALAAENGDRSALIATVAMEYTVAAGADFNDPDEPRFSVFYIFDNAGNRITALDLDGRGGKFLPGFCNSCHGGGPKDLVGGVYPDGGNTGAKYIPWDLATFEFEDATGVLPIDQDAFKVFNQTALKTDVTEPVRKTIHSWYGGEDLPSNTFFEDTLPEGWLFPNAPVSAIQLYTQVVRPYCRACHEQRGNELENDIDFDSYDKFMSYRDRIEEMVFDESTMPLALRTFERFHDDPVAVEVLADAIDSSRYLEEDEVVLPGRPIADAGPSRTAPLGTVILNGNASLFDGGSDAFSWTLSVPSGSNAQLVDPNSATTTFFADVEGDYKAQLVINDGIAGTPPSPPSEVVIQVSAQVRRSSFSRDIVPLFTACAACHQGFDNPRFNTSSILFDNVIEYVDLDDIVNSPILVKPSGNHHDGGTIPGFEASTSEGYQAILRWIAEGALDN